MNSAQTLDSLLHQSLAAVERTALVQSDVTTAIRIVLRRIARFYRTTSEIVVQAVVEPAAATLEFDGCPVRCPKLLVQCTRRGCIERPALTLVYIPTHVDRIALRIAHDTATYMSPRTIQWLDGDWCIPEYGIELNGQAHADYVKGALSSSGLFAAKVWELEPLL